MILTITPNPSIDVSYHLDRFETGSVHRVYHYNKVPGGKGLNVSKVLKQLGEDPVATGFLGGHSGAFIEEGLDKLNIRHRFTPIDGETRTSLAISAGSETTEIRENGPTVTQQNIDRFFTELEKADDVDVISLSGSLPDGVEPEFLEEILKKNPDKKIIYDVSGDALDFIVNKSPEKPYCIKPNRDELAALLGKDPEDVDPFEDLKKIEGIPLVILSLGKDGAAVKFKDRFFECRVPEITPVSPVGSGDSSIAGIAYGLENGLSIEDSLVLSMSLGVLNTLEDKIGYVNIDALDDMKKKITVKER